VTQSDDPSQEHINALHSLFCSRIKALFDDHKHILGLEWAQKELRIV
jgi:hypothetical protein